MTSNDPTPDAAAEEPATDGDEPKAAERQPPGPDDVPISNLPPPPGAGSLADELEAIEPEPEIDADVGPEPDPEAEPEVDEPEREPEPEPEPEPELELEPEPEPDPTDEEPVGDRDEAPVVPAVPPHHGWTRKHLTAIAVVVAVAASVLALAKAQQAGNLTSQRDDRRDIEQVAERFGSAYLSFDFEHADASAGAVRSLATQSFAASYVAQSAPGIQELFSSRQTRTKATTTAVYLGRVSSDAAKVLVVVDVTATSPTDGDQKLDDVSFVLDLARTDDGWRVAKVARAPQPSLDDGASTTTAAPPP